MFVAVKQYCTVFLTCDRRVLRHRDDIQELYGLTVQKPSDLVTSEGW